jgi:hypothetical protein
VVIHSCFFQTQAISAYDDDATKANRQFWYSLEGNGSDLFLINGSSGDITVKQAAQLDADYQEHYNLVVSIYKVKGLLGGS